VTDDQIVDLIDVVMGHLATIGEDGDVATRIEDGNLHMVIGAIFDGEPVHS